MVMVETRNSGVETRNSGVINSIMGIRSSESIEVIRSSDNEVVTLGVEIIGNSTTSTTRVMWIKIIF